MRGAAIPSEIVVVDQGRESVTKQIAEIPASAVMPIRYIRQDGSGLSRSRNEAFARASSPWVAVTDDDCVPDEEWLLSLYAAICSQPPPDAVTGRVLPLGPPQPGTFATSTRAGETAIEFRGRTAPWLVGTGANFVARRDIVACVDGYDERLGAGSPGGAGEDIDLLDRLLKIGARIRYEPSAILYHERKPLSGRLSTRLSYGRGIGGLCGLRLRERDLYGLTMLARWIALRTVLLLRALRQRDLGRMREELLVFRGTASGLAYGWSQGEVRKRGQRGHT
jgi:GT2 family glycosyltransferase